MDNIEALMDTVKVSYETLKFITSHTTNYYIIDQDRRVLDITGRTYTVCLSLSEFPKGLPQQLSLGQKYKLT